MIKCSNIQNSSPYSIRLLPLLFPERGEREKHVNSLVMLQKKCQLFQHQYPILWNQQYPFHLGQSKWALVHLPSKTANQKP